MRVDSRGCGHVTAATIAVPDRAEQSILMAMICWTLTTAVVVSLALGQGTVRGASPTDENSDEEKPGLAAYFDAAPQESVARVAKVVYGDDAIGSGISAASPSDRAVPDDSGSHEAAVATETGSANRLTNRSLGAASPATVEGGWFREFGETWAGPAEGVPGHVYAPGADPFDSVACQCGECSGYHWEFLPKDTLYPFYLADTKASRMAGQWQEGTGDGTLLDGTMGGRFGIFRYVDATPTPFKRGIQADFEGSAQVRLDMDHEHDVRAVDFRAGVPISVSFGRLQTRFGYYHLSSHVGDEFLIRVPAFDRLNYSRDVLFLGGAYWLTPTTRVYGEAGWAFYYDVCEPWEFMFGIEDAPRSPTGLRGAPFYAIHGRLQEEVDYGGSLTVQAGWAWQSSYDTGLLRTGLHYFNGKSNQFSFYDDHEELIGAGLWYDF